MTTTSPGSTGSFRYSYSSGTWTWSEELYALFGFRPGDVVPTHELIVSHTHPEHRAAVTAFLGDLLERAGSSSLWHRVVDAHGAVRQVLAVGTRDHDPTGRVAGFSGFVVDVTEAVRRDTARGVELALEQMAESRPAIEQAKGALMARYGLDDEAAFRLLRGFSQHRNVKLRDVARELVAALADGGLSPEREEEWDRLAVRTDPTGL